MAIKAVSNVAASGLKTIANSGIVKKTLAKGMSDPQYLARLLLLTSVSKDVISYTLRMKNAKKNKEIPEDKKPFVIQMDKATRLVTTGVQIGVGFFVSSKKFQNFFTSKLFKDIANNPDMLKAAKKGFASISTLALSTLIAKRIVVPLFAAPLASHYIKKNAKSEEELKRAQAYINSKFYSDRMTEMRFAFKARA